MDELEVIAKSMVGFGHVNNLKPNWIPVVLLPLGGRQTIAPSVLSVNMIVLVCSKIGSPLSNWLEPSRKVGRKVGKVCIQTKWPIRPALNFGFRGMKRLGILLLPPGWDASSSQGYPPALYDRRYPFIHLGEERQCGVKFLV